MTYDGPRSATDNDRLSDFALLNEAIACAAAADAYSTRGRLAASAFTLQFLLGRALELTIKSYLIHHGHTEKQLRKLSHGLPALLSAATAQGFALRGGTADADRACIDLLGHYYGQKLFEYPIVGAYQLVRSGVLRGIVDRAIAATFVSIWDESIYQYDRDRDPTRHLGLRIAEDAAYDYPPEPDA